MKCLLSWMLLACLMAPDALSGQEYSYTHYDIQDGLAGTTAYCITQDADGFIWVGTETGVSRFDGTHFKNFGTADGLPDIEVLRMFGDKKGRVWMAPFRKSICYYYKGKIYNPDNDSLLRKLSLKGNIVDFAEDAAGNILVAELEGLHLIRADGSVSNYDSIGDTPIRQCAAVSRSATGHFVVQEGPRIWSFGGARASLTQVIKMPDFDPVDIAMSPRWLVWRETYHRTSIRSLIDEQVLFRRPIDTLKYRHNTYSITDDSSVCFCEFTGATLLNLRNGSSKRFLPGMQVSRAFRDMDGNLWFTTLDHGLYRLNSEVFQSLVLPINGSQSAAVFSILAAQHSVWAGTEYNTLFQLSHQDNKIIRKHSIFAESKNKIFYLDTVGGKFDVVSSAGVVLLSNGLHFLNNYSVKAKWACRKDSNEIIIGGAWGCAIFDIGRKTIRDTLWRERVTALCYNEGNVYIGTFNGLYQIGPDKSVTYFGKNIPFLSKRISAIAVASDHTIWAASADDLGIIGVRSDSVVAAITRRQGLTSDLCRTLLIQAQTLWVGTDKGLNAVRLDMPGFPVTGFTAQDGLGSDMINTIYVDSPTVYVGTSTGVSIFDENRIEIGEPCRLRLLGVINTGRDRIGDTSHMDLSYRHANIRFEYVGISYRSAGKVRYRYRMLGLDSTWQETNEAFVNYPLVPSGAYRFQVEAINRFENRSGIETVSFVVETPIWKQTWLNLVLAAVALFVIWFFVSWRIRMVRRQQDEKARQNRRMAELEHIALQSQMNPHFIFNCLNSIQQFVFDKDMMATNEYISGFARLIRATLNHSASAFISVAEEVSYLTDYLSMEKMRFKNKMNYSIEVAQDVDVENSFVPPMLLQPYVENSIRHGLRHKTTGQGFITIRFWREGERLVVSIRDNGIGRKKARQYKTGEHIEYQSKGMSLTSDRIQMIRSLYDCHIEVRVEDLEDGEDGSDGTRIVISFPVFGAGVPPIKR